MEWKPGAWEEADRQCGTVSSPVEEQPMPRPWVVKGSPRDWSTGGLSEELELVWKLTVVCLPLRRLPSPLLSCPSLGFALSMGLVTGSVLRL